MLAAGDTPTRPWMATLSLPAPSCTEAEAPTDHAVGDRGVCLVGLFVGSRLVLVVVVDGSAVEAQGGTHLVHLHTGGGVRGALLVCVGASHQLTHDDHPVSLVQVVEDALRLVTPDHATVKRRGTVDPLAAALPVGGNMGASARGPCVV